MAGKTIIGSARTEIDSLFNSAIGALRQEQADLSLNLGLALPSVSSFDDQEKSVNENNDFFKKFNAIEDAENESMAANAKNIMDSFLTTSKTTANAMKGSKNSSSIKAGADKKRASLGVKN